MQPLLDVENSPKKRQQRGGKKPKKITSGRSIKTKPSSPQNGEASIHKEEPRAREVESPKGSSKRPNSPVEDSSGGHFMYRAMKLVASFFRGQIR